MLPLRPFDLGRLRRFRSVGGGELRESHSLGLGRPKPRKGFQGLDLLVLDRPSIAVKEGMGIGQRAHNLARLVRHDILVVTLPKGIIHCSAYLAWIREKV